MRQNILVVSKFSLHVKYPNTSGGEVVGAPPQFMWRQKAKRHTSPVQFTAVFQTVLCRSIQVCHSAWLPIQATDWHYAPCMKQVEYYSLASNQVWSTLKHTQQNIYTVYIWERDSSVNTDNRAEWRFNHCLLASVATVSLDCTPQTQHNNNVSCVSTTCRPWPLSPLSLLIIRAL